MAKRHLPLLAWLAVVGLPSGTVAQPVGPEFRVNTYTAGIQQRPAVASDANGNFVVVWYGIPRGVSGQRYDSAGNRLGGEFVINTDFVAGDASVASDASGNFVVVWGCCGLVHGQLYDSHGHPLGENFQVNAGTEFHRLYGASVASDPTGNFVVVWSSEDTDGDEFGIFGRRFDGSGNPLGDEFQVNTYTTADQADPAIASDANGNFVVVWGSNTPDQSEYGVFGQRYDRDGNPSGGEFRIDMTTGGAGGPSIASGPNGDFVVAWTKLRGDSVFGRRYDSDGNPLGDEFQVSTYVTGVQIAPAVVSPDESGNFVVVWRNYYYDPYGARDRRSQRAATLPTPSLQPQAPACPPLLDTNGINGQRFDNNGNRLGCSFPVNTSVIGYQLEAAVSSDPSGNFIVVWESSLHRESDIYGQRFSGDCVASVQAQGVHAPGSAVSVQVYIAHHRPKTVTVPWELSLTDSSGRVYLKRTTEPHTFEPGDVVDRKVQLQLPNDLASGTYTLELAISGMAGTKGATTTLQVVRAE